MSMLDDYPQEWRALVEIVARAITRAAADASRLTIDGLLGGNVALTNLHHTTFEAVLPRIKQETAIIMSAIMLTKNDNKEGK